MVYKSKKDETVTAAFDFEDKKCNTTRLIYLTGEKAGESFVVSNSTLKRYWTVVDDTNDNPLNLDAEQINTPYKPDVTPHYIPKPKSVVEYEEKKHKARYNGDLPNFEDIAEMLKFCLKKVNEPSKYVMFLDGSTLWRKSSYIDMFTTEDLWVYLTEAGLTSNPNKDKARPFAFRISTSDEFERVKHTIEEHGVMVIGKEEN